MRDLMVHGTPPDLYSGLLASCGVAEQLVLGMKCVREPVYLLCLLRVFADCTVEVGVTA